MKARAVFPFDAVAPSITEAPDPGARKAGTKYNLPAGVVMRAPVSCIATYHPGSPGRLRLAPTSPLELTGKLPGWPTIGVDAIVVEGLDAVIGQVAQTLTVRSNGNARKTIPSGESSAQPTVPADWASGTQAVYLEHGAKIWTVPAGGIDIRLSVVVAQGSVEILLDGDALFHAISDAGGFPDDGGPPTGFAFGALGTPLHGVGAAPEVNSGIETISCAITGVQVHGPPPATTGPLPPDVAFVSPGSGPVTLAVASGGTATWSAAVSDGTVLPPSASAPSFQIQLPAGWWGSRPPTALTCTVTAALPDGTTSVVSLLALEHAPVSDSGRASRSGIPASSGSPRVSVLVADLPGGSPMTSFGTSPGATATVDGVPATDVLPSPGGDRLFFAAPIRPAGTYDIVITVGAGSVTLPSAISYTDDIPSGLESLKASLAVAAEEAALEAETFTTVTGTDELRVCCDILRMHVGSFQEALATVGDAIAAGDTAGQEAWETLLTQQASFIMDTVNGALATLSSPPIASLDGQPVGGTGHEPDYDIDAFVVAVTLLDNVIVRSTHALGSV